MKKKISLLMILVGAVGLLTGYYTMCMFTASSTVCNSFSAGTIEIRSYRGGFDTISGPMFYTSREEGETLGVPAFKGVKPTGLWMPGKKVIRSLLLYNEGSLDANLEQVKADILQDDENLAADLDVKIYKVYPQEETQFPRMLGDETGIEAPIDVFTKSINRNILCDAQYYNVYLGRNQQEIEAAVEISEVLWEGSLYDLCLGYQCLATPIYLKACEDLGAYGCILAFQVSMKPNTGNEYQDTAASFDFQIKARQST